MVHRPIRAFWRLRRLGGTKSWLALVFAAVSHLAATAHATPPLSLEVAFGGGVGYAKLADLYRDDDVWSLRLGFALGRRVALDVGISEDSERVEPAIHLGARVRPFSPGWWSPHWSPYVRGDFAIVGASHLGSNFDLTGGLGNWGRFAPQRFPYLAWFIEVDTVLRTGELTTLSERITAGLAFTSPRFWR
jgi:hypothetical protein